MDCGGDGTRLSVSEELSRLKAHIQSSSESLARFERLLKAMESENLTDELLDECPELAQTKMEVEKLAYRAGILKQSIAEQEALNAKSGSSKNPVAAEHNDCEVPKKKDKKKEENKAGSEKNDDSKKKFVGGGVTRVREEYNYAIVEDFGSSIIEFLKKFFGEAVTKTYPEINGVPILISEATNVKFGDYQFNSSMAIAQKLSQSGKKSSPRDVATAIIGNLAPSEKIEKVEVAGPGYINVFLSKQWASRSITKIALEGISVPKIAKRRALVDFSSPNIAKQMHVGHLRSTIIGDSICRLLEYVGFEVLRINHIGDWGTQFGMLIAHLLDRFPNFLTELPALSDLQAFYKESKKRFDEDPDFKARAYDCVVKLQSYEPDFVKAWQLICDVSRKDFEQIYERLDIKITERGESFYHKMMPDAVKYLEAKGLVKVDDGRKVMFPTGCDVPLILVKSDGGYTYDTSDIAAIHHRLIVEKLDWLIYVVDAGQNLHFETIYAAARDLGWYTPKEKRVEHVTFGLVLGEDRKKFKTRSGDTVKLTDLLDEGVKRATQKLQEKERDKVMSQEELDAARDAVAYGCIKYADLSQTRTQDYVFSFDKMLDDRGNTAVYLLYAYARIRSICRNTGATNEEVSNYLKTLPETGLPLDHPSEFKLAKAILKFSDCVLAVVNSLMLHQMCDYVYFLATTFHDFYKDCYVIHKDREGNSTLFYHRLVLCQVTADVMADCFKILGIRTVEKM